MDLPTESKGGTAHQVHGLANALVLRGHHVTVFTFSPAPSDAAYQLYRYQRRIPFRRLAAFEFAFRLRATDFSHFDLVHANGDNYLLWKVHPQLRTFMGSAIDEAATATSIKRRIYQTIIARLEELGSRVSDVCVGISRTTSVRLPRISEIVPCGVDLLRFRPGDKAEKPTILFVGTAGGRKRGDFLSEIFNREVRARIPEAELWSVADRPMHGQGVRNFGRVSDDVLSSLFQRAWVFCLPSTYEGFGVPYIEAMAAGTAVVASSNAGAREVLMEGDFGLIADDSKLGAAIVELLQDRTLRSELERRGIQRAAEFAWPHVAARYEALYSRLIGMSRIKKVDDPLLLLP